MEKIQIKIEESPLQAAEEDFCQAVELKSFSQSSDSPFQKRQTNSQSRELSKQSPSKAAPLSKEGAYTDKRGAAKGPAERRPKDVRRDLNALLEEGGLELYFQVLREFVQSKKSDFEKVARQIDSFEKTLTRSSLFGKAPEASDCSFRVELEKNALAPPPKTQSEEASYEKAQRESTREERASPKRIRTAQIHGVLSKREAFDGVEEIGPKETNTSDVIKKVILTLVGEQPERRWLAPWSKVDRQIFWLLMTKVWSFSGDWEAELNFSSDFPRSKGKLFLPPNVQFAFYEKKFARAMLNEAYFDFQKQLRWKKRLEWKQMPESFDFLFGGGRVAPLLRSRSLKILKAYFFFVHKSERKEIQVSRLIKMQEVGTVLHLLARQPDTPALFRKTTELFVRKNNYSKQQMVLVIQRIATAIKKLRRLILVRKLPLQGLQLNLDQQGIMKKINVFKPIEFWKLCFQRILAKLQENSPKS